MIPFFILDKQEITRLGMRTLAERLGWFAVKEVETKAALLPMLARVDQAIVVLDYTSVEMSVEHLLILKERFTNVHWILFSDSLSESFLYRISLEGKAFSILLKDLTLAEIGQALRFAKEDKNYICERVKLFLQEYRVKKEKTESPLTLTEQAILKEMALGKTTKQIADNRNISVYTVMTHRKNIFRKLNLNNVHEVTKYALKAGIVEAAEYYI